MRIKILSDLHVDYNQRYNLNILQSKITEGEFDFVILAGDIGEGVFGLDWAQDMFIRKGPFIYIPGNHEYYHNDKKDLDEYYASQFFVYNNRTYIQDSVRFICSPLWSNFALNGNPELHKIPASMEINDFRIIENFSVDDCISEFNYSYYFIEEELKKPWNGKTVLVTHFGVSPMSLHEQYGDSPLNPYFVNDISEIFEKYDIDLCIHGHTHSSCDYEIYGTRVICNPFGYHSPYSGYENKNFNPNLIVEV